MAKKFLSDIELDAGLVDVNGNTGTSGQILSSTGTAVDWVNQADVVAGEADKALSLTLTVKNTESVALTKGQVVCAAPTATPPSGNVIEVKLADNNGTDSMPAIGILNEGLDAAGGANDEGEAIMFGRISGINTSAFSVGDEVFVSDTAGGLTATKPTGVKYIQKVGVVMRDDASNGTIEIFGAGRTNDVPTPLYIDHANQRVGIGEETPSSDLHINNDSTSPVLRLSYVPASGYGGGGSIRFQGGASDYVYGDIGWWNGSNKDADITYSAASRAMTFKVNDRSVSTNGYFRFYNDNTEVAEINAAGIYGNVFYDQGNSAYYVNPAGAGNSFNALGYAHIRGGITTDGSARSYTWRALDNTGSSGTRYQKIARITSTQSSRFVIELAGRSTSYSTPLLPAIGYIVGQLNNDNDYDLVFYNHSGEDTVVDEVGQVDVSTTATDIYIKVSSFSEVTAHAHISDGTIAVESTSAGGTEPTNYVAATNITVWNSRNDGAGSGLDADLLDGQQGSYYLDYNNFTNTPTIPSPYTHPTHPGDDINLDTGALTGATVISDLDFNVTTDTLGHVTDANATYSTRNLTASDIGAASSSHTHDDRYYTETEMQTFFNRGYISAQSASNLAIGWYTIATNTGNRALGEFQIWDVASSRHQSVLFNASHHYGTDNSNDITVLANSRFGTDVFRYLRIREGGTYDGAALQVYIDNSTNSVNVAITGANAQSSGWVLKDWIPNATDPGDVDNYSSFTNKCQVDLDNIQNGGIATTGDIFSGGALTQYRNLTTADEGSGNGLDADTLDGQHASAFASSSHNHDSDYVELTGDTMSGPLIIDESDTTDKWLFRVDNNGSNFSGFWSASQDIQLYLRDDAGNVRVQLKPDARSLFYDGLEASILHDSDNTSYYVNPAQTSNLQELEILRNSSTYTVNLTDAHDRAGLMIKSSTNFDSKIAFSSGASSRQYIQALNNAHTTGRDIAINPYGGNVAIGKEAPAEALDVDGSITSNATIWTGYDSGVTNSVSCSNWFRSSGSTGWFNSTYSGGIYMADSTWVRVYNNKKFFADNTIESNTAMYAPIFYDRNNTNYRFHGDQAKDGVDLTSGGNYAINVLGTISGGHRKHGNLETPEMQWSVGGSTDLNWKKLCDVVISDANYAGWGAEIEITDFSGNFGNAAYNGGELFKGALSIYHRGGSGTTPEIAYANIPYEMRSHVRWYKIEETGQNRYQLQVKSPADFRQLYVKVKPGIGNQIADIISYANDTNGTTSGGTAYASIQNANFNHEFAGGIWTNDTRAIGWKNGYGSPYLSTYYGGITTSATLYLGGNTATQDLYCDQVRSNSVLDKSNSAYYFDGGNTGDSIRVAGDVVAYYSSDKRLKDNIKPIENALDKVKAISGVTFEWNEKSHKTTGKKDVGVVAQEVEEVLPELVETRTNGFKAVDYQKLTAVLIESVKELTAKVEALESKQCNCK